jgi:hypothetical protein
MKNAMPWTPGPEEEPITVFHPNLPCVRATIDILWQARRDADDLIYREQATDADIVAIFTRINSKFDTVIKPLLKPSSFYEREFPDVEGVRDVQSVSNEGKP